VNGQTAWSLLTKTERHRVYLISALPGEEVRKTRMMPAHDLAEIVGQLDSSTTGYILPRGASLLPFIKT